MLNKNDKEVLSKEEKQLIAMKHECSGYDTLPVIAKCMIKFLPDHRYRNSAIKIRRAQEQTSRNVTKVPHKLHEGNMRILVYILRLNCYISNGHGHWSPYSSKLLSGKET